MPSMNFPGCVTLGYGSIGGVLLGISVVILVNSVISLVSEILIANICTVLYS